jgi:hypothetical protein
LLIRAAKLNSNLVSLPLNKVEIEVVHAL